MKKFLKIYIEEKFSEKNKQKQLLQYLSLKKCGALLEAVHMNFFRRNH